MELSKVEFNGVEYEAKGLIEFSSLTKLIFELVNRQKDLEKKFEEINQLHLVKQKHLTILLTMIKITNYLM